MAKLFLLTGVLSCAVLSCVLSKQLMKLEAEDYKKDFIHRENASNAKTVNMHEDEAMSLTFCLRRKTTVIIVAVLYSNDGPENIIRVSVDGMFVGQETSHNRSDNGFLWNEIHSTGPLGEPAELRAGPHKIQIHIKPVNASSRSDPWGIEIDAVFLGIDDNEISEHYLHCRNTMCSGKITYSDRHRDRDDVPAARLVQFSRPSTCLEEDNIKMPIYHDSVKQFRISALPPRYRTFWTFKDAQFDGCPAFSRYHWQYTGVHCDNEAWTKTHRNSFINVDAASPNGSDKLCRVAVHFDLEGIFYGRTDAHIGSILEVAVDRSTAADNLVLTPVYGVFKDGQFQYQAAGLMVLNGKAPYANLSFPDMTWEELNEDRPYVNQIVLELPRGAVLNYIRLKRREETPQKETMVYDNFNVQIHTVAFDFWWRDPAILAGKEKKMEVFIENMDGEATTGYADYIRFVEKRVWSPSGDMDQTFVLYQDGSARILPIVPHGLDSYVPYSNDIVIGQGDPTHLRPNAPIKKLVIKPVKHLINVYYNDGGSATFHLTSGIEATNVTVSNITFAGDYRAKPFTIFRSTWVEDGRSKVDHLSVNGLPSHHVLLDSWTELFGTTFIFFRKCVSVYNTQSPDYSLEILSDSEL